MPKLRTVDQRLLVPRAPNQEQEPPPRRAPSRRMLPSSCSSHTSSLGSDRQDTPPPPSTPQQCAPRRLQLVATPEQRRRLTGPLFPITLSAARDTQQHLAKRLEMHFSSGSSAFDFDEDCEQVCSCFAQGFDDDMTSP